MHWLTVLLFSSLIGIKLYFIILCFLNYRWDCHSFHICFWWYFLGAAVRLCPWLIFPLEPRWSSQVCIRRETSWPSDSQLLLPDILIGRLLSSFLRTSRFPTEMWIAGFSWKAQDMEIHGPSSCVWTGKGSRAAWPPYKGHDARSTQACSQPRALAASIWPALPSTQWVCKHSVFYDDDSSAITLLSLIFWLMLPSNFCNSLYQFFKISFVEESLFSEEIRLKKYPWTETASLFQ